MLLKQAMTELGLSARAHDKILRIARTIADLEGDQNIQAHHLINAVQWALKACGTVVVRRRGTRVFRPVF